MLTLYQFNTCPFCWKVKALLNYTKQPYETVEVTPFSMKELDFTDHKKVPVLKDGEHIIVESAAIVDHINTHHTKLPVTNDSTEWTQWIDEKLARYLPILIHPDFGTSFKHMKVALSGTNMNPFKRAFLRFMGSIIMPKVSNKMMAKYSIQQPETEFLAQIDHWVDNGLNQQVFHGGDKPDFVDCSVFGVLYSSHSLGVIDLAKAHNKTFSRWYDSCLPLMT